MLDKTKGFVYHLTLYLAALGFRKRSPVKKLLLVRVDEIGDFMLWHTLFDSLFSGDEFKAHEIHFCGNQSWKTLFDQFHAGSVQHSVWIDKFRFKKDMIYRYNFLKQVYREGYDTVINPTFSRDIRNDDSIVSAAKAKHTIGMVANLESTRSYERGYDHNLYTRIFDHPEKPIFEFRRNQLFAEFVSGRKTVVQDTRIDAGCLPIPANTLPGKYFVVFPGSRNKTRTWPAENFALVSDHLSDTRGWTAVVAGSSGDQEYAEAFMAIYRHAVIDLTGKTSLVEMLSILKNAQCLLTVDTGSVHLAAAVGCTVFGIFNGSQYGRFAPYPREIAGNVYAIYPDEISSELSDPAIVKQKYEFVVAVPYSSVNPEKVILKIHQHFPAS